MGRGVSLALSVEAEQSLAEKSLLAQSPRVVHPQTDVNMELPPSEV